jgi:hypothetical protein
MKLKPFWRLFHFSTSLSFLLRFAKDNRQNANSKKWFFKLVSFFLFQQFHQKIVRYDLFVH